MLLTHNTSSSTDIFQLSESGLSEVLICHTWKEEEAWKVFWGFSPLDLDNFNVDKATGTLCDSHFLSSTRFHVVHFKTIET